jgi:sulfate/thiosulfate transport system ATP-binding protein
LVTHDQEEAMEVSDRVVVMHDGRVEQVGTPEEVYHIPKSEFVLNFLGNVNLFHGRVEAGQAHIGPGKIENAEIDESVAGEAKVFIRPHDLEIHQFEPQGKSSFPAKVRHINAAGSVVKVELMGEDGANFFAEITHDVNRELNLADGDHVFVHVKDVRVFLQEKGEAE